MTDSDPEPALKGPRASREWRTGERAVNAFDRFCLEQGWVFVVTPGQRDFGRDGIVDFTRAGELTGHSVGVQIKGGRSWARSTGYAIEAKRSTRAFWMRSTVPIIGIVWDPDDDTLHWVAVTSTLREHGVDSQLIAPSSQSLSTEHGLKALLETVDRDAIGPSVFLDLAGDDLASQVDAVFACSAFGRTDIRYLVLLRRAMFNLHRDAFELSLEALDVCSLNPDHYIAPSWMSQENRRQVRRAFGWTPDEVVELLQVVDPENGFGRGSLGQVVYWLIVGDDLSGDSFVQVVEEATRRAALLRLDRAATNGLLLLVFWAGDDGRARLQQLVGSCPEIIGVDGYLELVRHLHESGRVDIY